MDTRQSETFDTPAPTLRFKPVVGDNVNFFTPDDGGVWDVDIGRGPYAAMVTKTYGNSFHVGLTVFPPMRDPVLLIDVPPQHLAKPSGPYWDELPLF